MKISQRKLANGSFEITATASPADVDAAFDQAHFTFAEQMGLRPEPNKTVAQVAEAKMGIKDLDTIVQNQALEALVPYALDKRSIVPAFPPEPRLRSELLRGQPCTFEFIVTPKPEYELTSYEPVHIVVPPFQLDKRAVHEQMEKLAHQHLEWQTAEPRAIGEGDAFLLALECSANGVRMEGLCTPGRTYMMGKGLMPEPFEKELVGMKPGDTKKFSFDTPSVDENDNEFTQQIDCEVTILEMQQLAAPEITDAWVEKNLPGFGTAADLRASIAGNLEREARNQYEDYKRQLVVAELGKRFKGTIDDAIYAAMRSTMTVNLRSSVQQQGIRWEDYIEQQGGQTQFDLMLMRQTRDMLVQGFALDALYRHEKLTLTEEDWDYACETMNPGADPKLTRKQMEQQGKTFALREMAERFKANRYLIEHADIEIVEA